MGTDRDPRREPRLAVVGGGNMGGAVVRGAVRSGVLAAEEILVVEPDASRRAALEALGCRGAASASAARGSGQIMLAVKPQLFEPVAAEIAPLGPSVVVVSVMAGIGSQAIRSRLGGAVRVVRAMPNTPCSIGAGMTAVASGAGALPGDEALARRIFDALGRTVVVDESLMHAVTALSGSGPAYLFRLAEAMRQAAVELGFDRATGLELVRQTLLGSALLLRDGDADPSELRRAVTSPGGTTAAAMQRLDEDRFDEAVVRAIVAARDRGVELGAR